MVYTSQVWDTNIWRRDSQGHGQPEKVIESTRLDENPQYSPDGTRIAFASARTGAFEIWVAKSDGTDVTQLTSMNADAAWPTWSPDGKKIAFNANRSKTNFEIYVINSDGGTPRPLTTEASLDAKPSWSVEGNWIYFGSDRSGVLQIWKVPANGGPAVQVTHQGGDSPAVSPDGRFVYYAGLRQKVGVWRIPTNGGNEEPVLEDLPGAAQGRWVPARNGIYFAVQDKAGDILYFRDLGTGRTARIARFEKRLGPASPLSLSPDHRWLLYAQIDESSVDLLMLENFR